MILFWLLLEEGEIVLFGWFFVSVYRRVNYVMKGIIKIVDGIIVGGIFNDWV